MITTLTTTTRTLVPSHQTVDCQFCEPEIDCQRRCPWVFARTLAPWVHGGYCELGRVECGQPATHRLTSGAGDWLICGQCADGEGGREDTLVLEADDCPAGGAHSFVLVPAGIDTGLYMAAWLCDECSAAAPRVEVEYDGPGTGFDEEAGW